MNYNEEERLQKDKKKVEKSYKKIKNIYNHFMNGVSRLIPILMIYGIISQIMIMLGIDQSYYIYNDAELGWFMNLNLENILASHYVFRMPIFCFYSRKHK